MSQQTRFVTAGFFAAGLIALGSTAQVHAATFVAGADPTTTFDNLLLDDVTPGTGQDTNTATAFGLQRDLAITTGAGPQEVTITGIGFNPRGGTSTSVETVTVNITYIGADLTFGTADDVFFGEETASLQYLGSVDQYTAVFDNAMTATIDGVEDRFRFLISSTGNMRFKQWNAAQAPSGEFGLKLSVGGTAVPEPGSLALLGLGGLLIARRRRG